MNKYLSKYACTRSFLAACIALLSMFICVPLPAFDAALSGLSQAPVAYKGRFRPLEAAAKLWLEDFYGAGSPLGESPQAVLLHMHFNGRHTWDETPFFFIENAQVKKLLEIDADRISYNSLKAAFNEDKELNLKLMHPLLTYYFFKSYVDPSNRSRNEKQELVNLSPGLWVMFKGNDIVVGASPKTTPWSFLYPGFPVLENGRASGAEHLKRNKKTAEELFKLLSLMQQYEKAEASSNSAITHALAELQEMGKSPTEISEILENRFPLASRLAQGNPSLRMLPNKYGEGEWLSLEALKTQTYDVKTNALVPIANFTKYPDGIFNDLRNTYYTIDQAFSEHNKRPSQETSDRIALSLQKLSEGLFLGYATLAGSTYKSATEKKLYYPSRGQLYAEWLYTAYPFAWAVIALYGISLLLFLAKSRWAVKLLLMAFLAHTLLLGLRCYILDRPPVSNMFETVIYVPWIAAAAGWMLFLKYRKTFSLIAGAIAAWTLLTLLQVTHVNSSLENVQAVLDSQYWLIVHVMLVVGSYGAFVFSALLAHGYVFQVSFRHRKEITLKILGNCILFSIYAGLTMLIPGTLLGGVWAAESWGRFWDWDPKESWAFISICSYLIFVHAFRFGYIRNFGLAVGSIIGLQIISFTWYGVNYILGTGLHSYGWGSGGDFYYFLFLAGEVLFVVWAISKKKSCNAENKKILLTTNFLKRIKNLNKIA